MIKTILSTISEDYIFGKSEKTKWDKIMNYCPESNSNFEPNNEIEKKIKNEIENCLLRLKISKKLINIAEKEDRTILGIGRDAILIKGVTNEKIGNSRQTGLLFNYKRICNDEIKMTMELSSILIGNKNLSILNKYLEELKDRYDDKILLYDIGETGSQLKFFEVAMKWKDIRDIKTCLISYKKPQYINELIKVHKEATNDLHPIKPFKILNKINIDENIIKFENLRNRFVVEETVRNLFEKAIFKNKSLDFVWKKSIKNINKLNLFN